MGDYQTAEGCQAQIDDCPGARHAAETYTKVVRIESDIQEMKG